MKIRFIAALLFAAASAVPVFALEGQINCHDPGTVTECDGKYFTFGTSGNLMSVDGWTWTSNAVGPGGGVAPDICKVGDRYLVTAGGINARWTKSLDPASPDFGYSPAMNLTHSDGSEFNSIDSSLMVDPNDGKLYMTGGSYVGYIRLYELDKQTGQLANNGKYTTIAIDCEASCMIFQDGWYYLFGNKGSCCAGSSSGYNIRMGRAKTPQGPFMDNMNNGMLQGSGKLLAASTGRWIGPGHFGRLTEDDGVQKWSMHYEADLDRGGASVLDIRPLYFKDGWPVSGMNILKETTYKVSGKGGAALQPGSNGEVVITPVPNVGGYPGMPFCKITVGGKVLAINSSKELATAAEFTSAPEQLWRLDQLIDGSWRIVPRTISKNKEAMALTAKAGGGATLAKYDYKDAGQHWDFAEPGDPKVLKDGKYEVESARTGRALEIAVEGQPVGGGGRGGGGGFGRATPSLSDGLIPVAAPAPGGPPASGPAAGAGRGGRGARGGGGGGGAFGGRGGGPIADQEASAVSANWPAGNVDLRLANYMCEAQQKWTIQPVANAAGYYKLVVAGTDRALAAVAGRDLVTVPAFSGAPEQLWRFDRLEDGTWKITPKSIPGVQEELVLASIGTGGVTLAKFDAASDKQRWNVKAP